MFMSAEEGAVADVVGNKARGGTTVATFQMMSDLGGIVGSFAVGQIAQYLSFGTAFVVTGVILLLAAFGWLFAPETRPPTSTQPTPARPLGPDPADELP